MNYKFYNILEKQPEYFDPILTHNGSRYAVIYRNRDNKQYYVEQDGLLFFPQFWCELPEIK